MKSEISDINDTAENTAEEVERLRREVGVLRQVLWDAAVVTERLRRVTSDEHVQRSLDGVQRNGSGSYSDSEAAAMDADYESQPSQAASKHRKPRKRYSAQHRYDLPPRVARDDDEWVVFDGDRLALSGLYRHDAESYEAKLNQMHAHEQNRLSEGERSHGSSSG